MTKHCDSICKCNDAILHPASLKSLLYITSTGKTNIVNRNNNFRWHSRPSHHTLKNHELPFVYIPHHMPIKLPITPHITTLVSRLSNAARPSKGNRLINERAQQVHSATRSICTNSNQYKATATQIA